ncbi:MAG: TetR/AcrR family transcriptional regulator [Desulfobulbus sp.]
MKKAEPGGKRPSQSAPRRVGAPAGPRKASQRRDALIQAAGELFVEKGYEATSMDEIAAKAGFAKGTLYHYFANKAELLQVLREGFENEVMRRIRSRMETCPADDWHGRIRAWIDAATDGYFEMNELHDVVIYGIDLPFRYAMANAEITKYLAQLISDGAQAGAWDVEDEQWVATVMFYSFRGGCDEVIMGTQPPESIGDKLYDLFLRILGAANQETKRIKNCEKALSVD